jgi:hypothetical protein
MNKEQQALLGEAYEGYVESYNKGNASGIQLDNGTKRVANIDEFIRRIRQDIPFAEKWGLKFEKRELSWEERRELVSEDIARGRVLDRNGLNQGDFGDISPFTEKIIHYWMNQFNIPTKLITITYKETIIESYE